MSNKKLIKNLLTTASTLAVLASGTSAFAVEQVTSGDAVLSTGVNTTSGTPWVDDNTIKYGGVHKFAFDKAAIIASIDTNGKAPDVITITENVSVGTITDLTGGGTALDIKFNADAKTLTFTGTKYDKVAKIDFNNKANGALIFTAVATVTDMKLQSSVGTNGSVQISNNVIFNKVVTVAGNLLDHIAIDNGKTLTLGTDTDLSAGAMTAGIKIDAGHLVLTNDAKSGVVKISGAGTIIAGGTSEVGNTTVNLAGIVTINDAAKIDDVILSAGGILNVNSTNATATGNVVITAAGIVNVNGGATGVVAKITAHTADSIINLVSGEVTEIAANAVNNGAVTVAGNATIGKMSNEAVASVNFKADALLTLGNGGAHKATAVTTSADGTGSISLAEDATVGTVGTADKALKNITFAGDKILTISDATFNVKTVDGKDALANAVTKIKFTNGKTVDVSGTIFGSSDGKVIGDITVDGANEAVAFGDSLVNVKTVTLNNAAAKATIGNIGNAGTIIDSSGNGGIVIFNNTKAITLAKLGTTTPLTSVTLNGGNVTVAATGEAKITSLIFDKAANGAIFEVNKLNNLGAVTTLSTTNGGTVKFKAASELKADFGAKANALTSLTLDSTTAVALDAKGKSIFADVQATTADMLTVNAAGSNAADTTYGGFGTKGAKLAVLAFNGATKTATVGGEVFSKSVTVTDTTKIIFSKSISDVDGKGTGLVLAGTASSATFSDGADLGMTADGAADNNGLLVFSGSHKLGKIGATKSVKSIDFQGAAGKTITLTEDISAENAANSIKFAASTVDATAKDITITGQVAATGTIFNVGGKALTLAKASTLTTATVNATYDATAKTVGGIFTAPTNDLTVGTSLTFNIAGDRATPGTSVANFLVAQNAEALRTTKGLLVLNAGDGLTSWGLAAGTAGTNIALVAADNSTAFFEASGITNVAVKSLLQDMNKSASLTGDAATYLQNLQTYAIDGDEAKIKDATNRLVASTGTAAVTANMVTSSLDTIAGRMNSTTTASAGISSGDEDGKMDFGIWANGFGSRSIQKARKGDAGYKGKVMGGTIGADTMVSDTTTIGLAVSSANSELKFKDAKAGDKTKSTNMFFSVYSKHDMANNWFVQGSAGFGSGQVKSTLKTALLKQATAKYDTMAFSLEALAGYNFRLADATSIVPAFGVRYMNVNEGGYTEKGVGGRTTTKKASDKLTGILGAALQGSYDMGGTMVAPEVHAYVNYDFKAKNPKVEAKLDGYSGIIDVTSSKSSKVGYNVGTSLTAKTGAVEYGVGYDARLGNKFVSHQGTLRLRVDL